MTHNQAAVDLLAARLSTGLIHPGNPDAGQQPTPILLPGLSGTGIPEEMAAEFAREAGLPTNNAPRMLAEAIVALIETDLAGGSTIIATTELDTLRTEAAEASTDTRIVSVHCTCDSTMTRPLLELPIGNTDRVTVNGGALLRGMDALNPNCPHGPVL